MNNVFKLDDIKSKTLSKLNQLVKENIDENTNDKKNTEDDDKIVLKNKINTAKFYGKREIDTFQELTQNYINEVNKLCLFNGYSELIEFLFIDHILNGVIKPIFNGYSLELMDEEFYRKYRASMFNRLINTYVKKED